MARIFVVEDDETIARMEENILLDAGHKVSIFKDGSTALTEAIKNPPDLILLDIMMSGLSGIELAKALKSSPSTSKIPILFVTSRTTPSQINEGLTVGAAAYLTKPFSSNRLISLVETLLTSA